MVAIETESIDNAITAGLPSTVAGVPSHYVPAQVSATDDEQLSATSFLSNLAQQQVLVCNLQVFMIIYRNLSCSTCSELNLVQQSVILVVVY